MGYDGTNGTFLITSDSYTSFISYTTIFNNITAQINKITISSIPNSQYSISFTSTLGTINGSRSISFNCELYDMKSISIQYTPNVKSDFSAAVFAGSILLSGLKYKANGLELSSKSFSDLTFSDSKKATYFIYKIFDISTFNLGFNCSVYFINLILPYPHLSLIVNSITSVNDIMYYPNSPRIQTFTYLSAVAFSVNVNYTGLVPLIISNQTRGLNLMVPLYQNDKGTVFFGSMVDSGNITLISQYGSSLMEINSTSISINSILSGTYFPNGITYIFKSNLGTFSNMTFFSLNFSSTIYFNNIDYSFSLANIKSIDLAWPFGFESGTNYEYSYKVSFLLSIMSTITYSFFISTFGSVASTSSISLSNDLLSNDAIPTIKSFEMVRLNTYYYLIRIAPSDGFVNGAIIIDDEKSYRYESLVEGDGINGLSMYEIILENSGLGFTKIEIHGSSGKGEIYNVNQPSYYSIDPPKSIYDISKFNTYNLFLIQNVSFLFNNLNTTNKSIDNIMYFNFTNIEETNVEIGVTFFQYYSFFTGRKPKPNYAKWNSTIQMFQVEFTVPANIKTGYLNYMIRVGTTSETFYSQILPTSNQLYVTSSRFDQYGPIFKTINKTTSQNPNQIKWSVTIEDSINGFDYGYAMVRGDMDGSRYTINLSNNTIISGDVYFGQYEIVVTIPDICTTQTYSIIEIQMFDRQGYQSEFNIALNYDISSNPFINYAGDPTINQITFDCDDYFDSTPPLLLSFQSTRIVSPNDNSQTLYFEFQVTDPQSGLKSDQLPIVYATSKQLEVIFNTSQIKKILNSNTIDYLCQIDVPYGFGYQSDIIFSVYGLINNGGYFSGYSTEKLMSISPNGYYMSNIPLVKRLLISKVSEITSSGGQLLIIGKQFQSDYRVQINYLDGGGGGNLGFSQVSIPIQLYSTSIIINDIKPTSKPFIIKVVSSNNINQSNEYMVYPKVYNFIDPSPKPPLQPRIPCAGTPECGGSNNGYCKENYGCICYSPWIGVDCTSKVIIVPQPNVNVSNPSTEIPVSSGGGGGGNGGNGIINNGTNTETIFFKSLISLVSLRELDFQSNVIQTYPFQKWIYTQINNFTNQYVTNITIPKSNTTTTITATLQWFKDKSIIKFANQQLVMNPSSIKYTIDISSYDFSSKLNQLELIMSASISASKTEDICSSKEFGETSAYNDYDGGNNDISNYIKLQVDTVSLYGGFIKRAIVDSTVQTVSNVLLDSSMNPISNAASSQTFIGIQLPYYSNSIIIDPDFSVLIDSKSASNNQDSICSIINGNSGLSTAQLAGIIIGCVGFAIVVIISITFCIIKKRANAKFILSINKKITQVN
ncbi:hypothetical protein ACTA71_002282 [Dictyostelium dimigraforme]